MYMDPYLYEIPERVACYTRYSTDKQTQNSTKRQLQNCTALARAKGWPDPVHFLDEAISGRKLKREGLEACWAFCQKYPDTPVIVESVSRLARSSTAFAQAILDAKATNAFFYDSVKGYLDPPELHYQGARALEDIHMIATRLRDGLCVSLAEGMWRPMPPYGYMKDENQRLVQDPDTAPIVIEILTRLSKDHRPATIAKDLTKRGIPSPSGMQKWNPGSIIEMTTRPIYVGEQISHRPMFEEERRRGVRG